LSSIFFVAVYLPPQTNAGTKTALELYKAISKQENAHPEAVLLMAGDFNTGNLNPFYQHALGFFNGIEEYTTSVTGFINKCIYDILPTVTVRTYPKG
jgi:hypothetical protein